MRNEAVLQTDKTDRNILQTIKRKNANWIGHVFRNCFLQHAITGKVEGHIEVMGKRAKRCNVFSSG